MRRVSSERDQQKARAAAAEARAAAAEAQAAEIKARHDALTAEHTTIAERLKQAEHDAAVLRPVYEYSGARADELVKKLEPHQVAALEGLQLDARLRVLDSFSTAPVARTGVVTGTGTAATALTADGLASLPAHERKQALLDIRRADPTLFKSLSARFQRKG
jgi:hypothetical protein